MRPGDAAAVRRRSVALGLVVAILGACAAPSDSRVVDGSARFDDASWDDGLAVVSVFRGRVRRYGEWREAEARDYLVREFLDTDDLTKRDRPSGDEIPVLKANRMLSFETGTYGYRLMGSFLFHREDTSLLRARGSCQNACGLVTQSWDAYAEELRSDSYWEREGRSATRLAAGEDWRFADELPFVAASIPAGMRLRVLAPIAAPRSILRGTSAAGGDGDADAGRSVGIGIGDLCELCSVPEGGASPAGAAAPASVTARELRVEREGRTTRLVDDEGTVEAEFVVDERGFLVSWTVRDEQEFERVRCFRASYWELTSEADRRRVDP